MTSVRSHKRSVLDQHLSLVYLRNQGFLDAGVLKSKVIPLPQVSSATSSTITPIQSKKQNETQVVAEKTKPPMVQTTLSLKPIPAKNTDEIREPSSSQIIIQEQQSPELQPQIPQPQPMLPPIQPASLPISQTLPSTQEIINVDNVIEKNTSLTQDPKEEVDFSQEVVSLYNFLLAKIKKIKSNTHKNITGHHEFQRHLILRVFKDQIKNAMKHPCVLALAYCGDKK